MLSCFCPPPPVALTGKRMGQRIQQPTKQMVVTMRMKRKKRKASKDWCCRAYSSGIFQKAPTQLNKPVGKAGDRSL